MRHYARKMQPKCPHCGHISHEYDSRAHWVRIHLDRRRHRWWWKIKKVFKKGK